MIVRCIIPIFIAITLSSCGQSTSTRGLANRCTELYEAVDSELLAATKSLEKGGNAAAVISRHSPRINKLIEDIEDLRKDLATGGERHRWEWPLLVRSETIIRYEARIGGVRGDNISYMSDADGYPLPEDHDNRIELPPELAVLGQIGRSDLTVLGWFCNRPISALMPPVNLDHYSGMFGRLVLVEQSHANLEFFMVTAEEMDAYFAYKDRVGEGR